MSSIYNSYYKMWQFFLGFSGGLYLGTYYECKPFIYKIEEFITQQCPRKKDGEEDEKDN